MHITYIPETDTIDFDFRAERGAVFETIDGPNEDILLDFDEDGRLVGMTIENASRRTDLDSCAGSPSFRQLPGTSRLKPTSAAAV